ncbi:quinone oxidoreductase family protein [Parvibium lacunae]|uniref:Quinone oxidoreductase n=1 Tax=Parvibium lacunae TaxID=1888893 RepID=A0A368L7I7_9BURK|nr:quinone oxidoreductase [Parvibium lacunae]RCS59209.1 quinone oxidoreductase [Parvibium lacunae]
MAYAIRVHQTGGPEVLHYEAVEVGMPGPGEVRVKHHAIGLNYIDVYFRTGLYPQPLPGVIGKEAAGVIEAVGPGVEEVAVGDRVAYACNPNGAYATERVMPASHLVKLPDAIDFETAAAMMLQGLTAQYLLRRTYPVKAGDTILIHAAAGGVGLIACQWARALGATVIGTVSTPEKAALAQAHGCTHTILYTQEDVAQRVRALTNGQGVPVVYDSVGKDTLMASLDSLQPRGLFVSYGNASGPIQNFDLGLLAQKGSLYVTRPTLFSYTAQRTELLAAAQELFDVVLSGQVKISVNQRFALADAAAAHRALEARQTTGSTILLP